MVVVASLRAAFRVAAGLGAPVDRVNASAVENVREPLAGEQNPLRLSVDPSPVQGGVETAPAPAVDRSETQVRRRWNVASGEDHVGELEEGIHPPL
jgi:hypothetical protein